MKTIVLMVSKVFPAYHPRKGEYTDFKNLIAAGIKLHTLRGNYLLWKDRMRQVDEGYARISLRMWEGVPYQSKQVEFDSLVSSDDVGVQKLEWPCIEKKQYVPMVDGEYVNTLELILNDGLNVSDFDAWFKPYDLSKPMAIIHFTGFRY